MRKAKIGWLAWGVILLFLLFFLVLSFSGHTDAMWRAKEIVARCNVDDLVNALNAYYTEYGVMPEGDGAALLTALQRKNPKNINFCELESRHLSPKGELLDPWGVPYRIGYTKTGYAWAYSFGANKVDEGGAWATDDISSWRSR